MATYTCTDFIKLILKRGGRWRNKQIEKAIVCDYGVQFQNNTIAKYLSFLMKEGKVLSAPVYTGDGKACFEYWWVNPVKKTSPRFGAGQLKERCLEAAKTYPDGHPEVMKITIQISELEARERKVA